MSRIWNGGARAAAAVIGTRIAAGARVAPRAGAGDGTPPEWLSDPDHDEGLQQLSLGLYSELGEMLEARIGVPVNSRGAKRG